MTLPPDRSSSRSPARVGPVSTTRPGLRYGHRNKTDNHTIFGLAPERQHSPVWAHPAGGIRSLLPAGTTPGTHPFAGTTPGTHPFAGTTPGTHPFAGTTPFNYRLRKGIDNGCGFKRLSLAGRPVALADSRQCGHRRRDDTGPAGKAWAADRRCANRKSAGFRKALR